MKRLRFLVLFPLALAVSARATTYNAVDDFSLAANPNGVWSYGLLSSLTGGTFSPYQTPVERFLFGSEIEWCNNDTSGAYDPMVASDAADPSDNLIYANDQYFSPNELKVEGTGALSTVRWTAPAGGNYNVTGYFRNRNGFYAGGSASIVRNGKTLQTNTTHYANQFSLSTFAFNTGQIPAGTTFDFAATGRDLTGLSLTISDAVPNFQTVELVHTDGDGNVHDAETDLNSTTAPGAHTFITDFKGAGDVTIKALAGQVRDTTKDDFTSTQNGNNPTYLTSYLGSPGTGTGDGHEAGVYLLRTRPNQTLPKTSLEYRFAIPLTTSDRILIADVDGQEQYEIHAYHTANGVERELTLVNWHHQSFTGSIGYGTSGVGGYPDSSWAAWDADARTLTSQAQSSALPTTRERLDVLTPDTTKVDRIVVTTTQLMPGDDGAGIQIIHLPGLLPTIVSPATATAVQSQEFKYQIKANNGATAYEARGLPPGLTLDDTTPGLIEGTPTQPGTYSITLEASNTEGSSLATLTLTVKQAPPVISSPGTASGTVGTAFSYKITATHSPTRFGVLGLPPGLTVNATTGVISGKPTKAGTFNLTLKAINGGGMGTKTLKLTINPS